MKYDYKAQMGTLDTKYYFIYVARKKVIRPRYRNILHCFLIVQKYRLIYKQGHKCLQTKITIYFINEFSEESSYKSCSCAGIQNQEKTKYLLARASNTSARSTNDSVYSERDTRSHTCTRSSSSGSSYNDIASDFNRGGSTT